MELHDGNIRKQLRLMEADGLVRRDDEGQWSLTEGFQRPAGGVLTNA
jgi:DNA-binding IclR family transcriptional regulator